MKKFKFFKISHLVVLGGAMMISTLLGYISLFIESNVLYFIFETMHLLVVIVTIAYLLLALFQLTKVEEEEV
jgi:hypothetical protein